MDEQTLVQNFNTPMPGNENKYSPNVPAYQTDISAHNTTSPNTNGNTNGNNMQNNTQNNLQFGPAVPENNNIGQNTLLKSDDSKNEFRSVTISQQVERKNIPGNSGSFKDANSGVGKQKSITMSEHVEEVEASEDSSSNGTWDGPEVLKSFTWEEIQQHNKENDCWIVLNDKVYDVTSHLTEHPGGPAVILSRAGKNATRHFDQVGHSDKAYEWTKKYLVGKVLDTKRRYSAVEQVPSAWHETRRLAMLKGRHGKRLQEMMKEKNWYIPFHGPMMGLMALAIAVAFPYLDLANPNCVAAHFHNDSNNSADICVAEHFLGVSDANTALKRAQECYNRGKEPGSSGPVCGADSPHSIGYWLLILVTAYWVAPWFCQGLHHSLHEYAHNIHIEKDSLLGNVWMFITGAIVMSDLSMYYGPFHAIHHKYLGVSGRFSVLNEIRAKHPVSTYPQAELRCKADFNMEIEGYLNEAINFIGEDEPFAEAKFTSPYFAQGKLGAVWGAFYMGTFGGILGYFIDAHLGFPIGFASGFIFGFVSGFAGVRDFVTRKYKNPILEVFGILIFNLYHLGQQLMRMFIRVFIIVPIQWLMYTVSTIKHLKNITFASREKRMKSTATYMIMETNFGLYYNMHMLFSFMYLFWFHWIMPDGTTSGCKMVETINQSTGLTEQNLYCARIAGQYRTYRDENGHLSMWTLNWETFLWLLLGFGVTIRYAPYFSLLGPFWLADHAGYKHDSSEATGIPDTCQTTRSFYGFWSGFVTHGMNSHCEHHDHPRIPAKCHRELRRLYPEYYNHLKHYNFYPEVLLHFWSVRGKGYRYAACGDD